MRYKTRDIGEGGLDLHVVVGQAWLEAACTEVALNVTNAGLAFDGRLEPTAEGYLLRGDLRGELSVACARCLEPATVAVEVPMVVSFVEAEASRREEPEETQEDVVPFERGVVDLSDPIRDEILLAVPMRAVCRPDCAGICPTCGRNRNVTPCDCAPTAAEGGKLTALAKIKLQ
jgi:uncharacterized protein